MLPKAEFWAHAEGGAVTAAGWAQLLKPLPPLPLLHEAESRTHAGGGATCAVFATGTEGARAHSMQLTPLLLQLLPLLPLLKLHNAELWAPARGGAVTAAGWALLLKPMPPLPLLHDAESWHAGGGAVAAAGGCTKEAQSVMIAPGGGPSAAAATTAIAATTTTTKPTTTTRKGGRRNEVWGRTDVRAGQLGLGGGENLTGAGMNRPRVWETHTPTGAAGQGLGGRRNAPGGRARGQSHAGAAPR